MVDIEKLTDKSIEFIEKEFGKSKEDVKQMSMEQWHELRLKCFEIECSEIDSEGECSERGTDAANIASLKYAAVKSEQQ